MKIERKDASLVPTGADTDFPGTFEVILSAPTLDRDGDTLTPEGWKTPLPDRITFDSDHGMSVASTVGSGVPVIDKATGNLLVKGEFSSLPRAQEVRTLVKEGHINTTSVAFMNEKTTKDGKSVNVRELLNGAFVAIPSNRDALVLTSKAGARNSHADQMALNLIHDQSVTMGADCPGAKSFHGTHKGLKSLPGSLEATQDRVRDALEDANEGIMTGLVATSPDGNGGGTIVYAVYDEYGGDPDLFQQSYTDDGSVVDLTGTPTPVDLQESVVPDPDASRESEPATGTVAAPGKGYPPQRRSPNPGTVEVPTADMDELEVKTAHYRAALAIAE